MPKYPFKEFHFNQSTSPFSILGLLDGIFHFNSRSGSAIFLYVP